jgi:hypothetical protein
LSDGFETSGGEIAASAPGTAMSFGSTSFEVRNEIRRTYM